MVLRILQFGVLLDIVLLDTKNSVKREGNGSKDPCTSVFVSAVGLPESALDIWLIEIDNNNQSDDY